MKPAQQPELQHPCRQSAGNCNPMFRSLIADCSACKPSRKVYRSERAGSVRSDIGRAERMAQRPATKPQPVLTTIREVTAAEPGRMAKADGRNAMPDHRPVRHLARARISAAAIGINLISARAGRIGSPGIGKCQSPGTKNGSDTASTRPKQADADLSTPAVAAGVTSSGGAAGIMRALASAVRRNAATPAPSSARNRRTTASAP